jgi:hypothetical protein
MRDYMTLGSVPYEEDCIQMGKDGQREECRKFVHMLREKFVNIPEQASFSVKSNPYEYDCYYEAAVNWNDDDEESTQFALFVESNIPARWDDTEQIDWKAPKVPAGWDVID